MPLPSVKIDIVDQNYKKKELRFKYKKCIKNKRIKG